MSSPVSVEVRDGIGVITVDNPPVNALSHAVRSGLVDGLNTLSKDEAVKAIVLRCAGRTFMAGADITEFGKPLAEPNLRVVIDAFEACDKAILAAIHGTALGGGLEVALGCHYRCALATARLGLPEVNLGLLPGAGGTQRSPRLIGAEAALDLMVSGKPAKAAKALELGLVDRVFQDGDLLEQALAYAAELVESGAAPRRIRDLKVKQVADGFFEKFRAGIARKTKGYLAPEKIIQCVEAAIEKPFDEGMAIEGALFLECMKSPQSKAQRHLFFAERQAAKIPDIDKSVPRRTIERVAVIGGGTMGRGIAMACLDAGLAVTLLEVNDEAADKALAGMDGLYQASVKKGRISESQRAERMARVAKTTRYEELSTADLVIEAVFENMDIKKEVFTKLDAHCKEGAILASNTSTLDLDAIAAVTKRPADVVGLHFFSPANVMRLLEVVRGKETGKDVMATVMGLAKTLRKVGVVSGVCYGFIGNRMLEPYGREVGLMLLEGAAPEHIDKVLTDFGFAMGYNAVMDLAGIDVGAKIRAGLRAEGKLPDPSYGRVGDILAEKGRLGLKTGAGIYKYEAGSRKPIPDPEVTALIEAESARLGIERRDFSDEEILERCLYPLINEAARILEEGIALRPGDIDVVWVYGYGFPPYRGGPLHSADAIGLDAIHKKILEFRERLGNDYQYWEPAPLLARLAAEGKGFAEL